MIRKDSPTKKTFKKNLLFLISSSLILFILSFAYIIFVNNDQAYNSPYYKAKAVWYADLDTITLKIPWLDRNLQINNKLLAGKIVDQSFAAEDNYLGSVVISFNIHNENVSDRVVFRLKETGKNDWYFQDTYDAKQLQLEIFYPFDFPPIKNSRNRSYTFQIESLEGTAGNSISINKTSRNFFTRYKFSKSELINPAKLAQFLITKLNARLPLLTNKEITLIFLFSTFPIIWIYMLLPFSMRITRIMGHDSGNVFFWFLKTFSIVAFVVLLTSMLIPPLMGRRKWIPYLSLLIPAVAISINYLKIEILNKKLFSIISGLIILTVLMFGLFNYQNLQWFGISGIIITLCYLLVMPLIKYRYFALISAGTFIFLLI